MHELFKPGEILEITNGSFKGLFGFFEKLQTPPWFIKSSAIGRSVGVRSKAKNTIAAA